MNLDDIVAGKIHAGRLQGLRRTPTSSVKDLEEAVLQASSLSATNSNSLDDLSQNPPVDLFDFVAPEPWTLRELGSWPETALNSLIVHEGDSGESFQEFAKKSPERAREMICGFLR